MIPTMKVDMMSLIKFLFSLVTSCCRGQNTIDEPRQTPRPTIVIPLDHFTVNEFRLLRRSDRIAASAKAKVKALRF